MSVRSAVLLFEFEGLLAGTDRDDGVAYRITMNTMAELTETGAEQEPDLAAIAIGIDTGHEDVLTSFRSPRTSRPMNDSCCSTIYNPGEEPGDSRGFKSPEELSFLVQVMFHAIVQQARVS